MIPKQILLRGAPELEPIVLPNGFHSVPWGRAQFGWPFCLGEGLFGRPPTCIVLSGRFGAVQYPGGKDHAFHESYLCELGKPKLCHYPRFSEDPLIAFRDLAHALGFAQDMLSGSLTVLQVAATRKAATEAVHRKCAAAHD